MRRHRRHRRRRRRRTDANPPTFDLNIRWMRFHYIPPAPDTFPHFNMNGASNPIDIQSEFQSEARILPPITYLTIGASSIDNWALISI